MQVPHITKLLAELENIAPANWKTWEIPNATAADFVTWAQSRARHTIAEVMGEIALAEQSQEQPLISAEEALALGAGAEFFMPESDYWHTCGNLENFPTTFDDGDQNQAIAMLQSIPMVSSAPVAWMNPQDLCADTAFRWCEIDDFTKPLFISLQPLTPITADALKELHHIEEFGLFCSFDEFEQIARAIEHEHGVHNKIKHKGDTK